MSGHSKWSTIKHKKAATDAKRGAAFTKIARLIEVAAKSGPDPEMNFRLKLAVQKAREANMPAANVDKAIRKGAGLDADKSSIEEITYEGVGPGNVAIMIEALTDNKNRTVASLRNIFTKAGGNLGNSGSVAWQFQSRGILSVAKGDPDLELKLIEAGADDINEYDDEFEVHTKPNELNAVKQQLAANGIEVKEAKLALVPTSMTKLTDAQIARRAIALIETLEDDDDVDQVYSNLEVDDSILGEIE